jgi:cytohesin
MRKGLWILAVLALLPACASKELQKDIPTFEERKKAFLEAARSGDLDMVKRLLAEGVSPNVEDENGQTALHAAVCTRNIEMVKFLVAQGSDVNARVKGIDFTPLLLAAGLGDKDICEFLIARGADVNAKDGFFGATALHYAASNDGPELVELLLANGAEMNVADTLFGRTPLHYAAMNGREKIAMLLIAKGADATAKDRSGLTPFLYAKYYGLTKLAEYLEKLPSSAADRLNYDLVQSAIQGDLGKIKDLLARGADVNARDSQGYTALHMAAGRRDKEAVEFLISRGAIVGAVDNLWKNTPLHMAAAFGKRETAELLIASGADINAKMITGRTPLHQAAERGHQEVVSLLIARAADINAKDRSGFTPLDLALDGGFDNVVNSLRQVGGQPGDPLRLTIIDAVKAGNCSRVKELLAEGANVMARDSVEGRTPLHLAARKGDLEMTNLLISKGADINDETANEGTPLHAAVEGGFKEIAEILLAKGANIEATTPYGYTPLHSAVLAGNQDMVELLLTKGANPDSRTNAGETATDLAEAGGHKHIVEILQRHSPPSGKDLRQSEENR